MRFLDVKTDFAFKKVFASADSKERLLSFLNSMIDFGNDNVVTDLEIVDPYNIPQLKGMKDTFVDVKAVLSDKTTVIVEMQVLNHQGFENRILYNSAKNYSMQLVKGERYDLLKTVIALTIVDFEMFPENDDLINCFKMINKKDFSKYYLNYEALNAIEAYCVSKDAKVLKKHSITVVKENIYYDEKRKEKIYFKC